MFILGWNKKSGIKRSMKEIGKEKFKLNKNVRIVVKSNGTKSSGDKQSNKNETLVDKECREDLSLKKRVIIKNDGRYLIYYDFQENSV